METVKGTARYECRNCGFQHLKQLFKVNTSNEPVWFFKCPRCHLVCTDLQIDSLRLKKIYSREYFREYYIKNADLLLSYFKDEINEIEQVVANKGRLVDVGCGVGFFPKVAQGNGWECTGVEISEYACNYGRDNFRLNIYQNDLIDCKFSDKSFKVITFWDTLEHLADPVRTLREVNRILVNDGLLVIKTPNINNLGNRSHILLSKLTKRDYFHVETHIFHFTPKTLINMLERSGFKVTQTRMVNEPRDRSIPPDSSVKLKLWLLLLRLLFIIDNAIGTREAMICYFKKG